MRLIAPPGEDSYAVPVRQYRVTFWQQQWPEPGFPLAAEERAWSAYHFDFAEVEDVHEVIEWAEDHFEEHTRAESPRGYVLAAWMPEGLLDEPMLIQIAGWDPTRAPSPPGLPENNLHRRHPLPSL
jgi:hypothetical protein